MARPAVGHTACALVHRPSLLLLDEPTVGSDVTTRAALLEAVRSLADSGAAIVYTTHYLQEIEQLGAHVVILDHGVVQANGSQAELLARLGPSTIVFELAAGAGLPPGIDGIEAIGPNVYQAPATPVAEFISRLGGAAADLLSLKVVKPDLEAVFRWATSNGSQSTNLLGHAPLEGA